MATPQIPLNDDIALRLAVELLKYRQELLDRIPPESAKPTDMIRYKLLCGRAGLDGLERSCGSFLAKVAIWCSENSWPPLNALAVNGETWEPGGGDGGGYDRAENCHLENWWNEAKDCLLCERYPEPSEILVPNSN